jgi:hypothetical protein
MRFKFAKRMEACEYSVMSFKIIFRGIEIVAGTAAEAAALTRDLAGATEVPKPLGRPPKQLYQPITEPEFDPGIALLVAIRTAGDAGLDTDQAVMATKARSGKAMGGIAMGLNNRTVKLGLDPKEVFDNARAPDGSERRWKAGPKITEAITALQSKDLL